MPRPVGNVSRLQSRRRHFSAGKASDPRQLHAVLQSFGKKVIVECVISQHDALLRLNMQHTMSMLPWKRM